MKRPATIIALALLPSLALAEDPVNVLRRALDASTNPAIQTSTTISPNDVQVIDGDTIRIIHRKPSIRLVGFNTPETNRIICNTEFQLGLRATRRLQDIVRAGNLTLEYVTCACPPGTQGTPRCNRGRDCGTLRSNGRDVGDILIEEGLAVPFKCGATSCPRTPRPWC